MKFISESKKTLRISKSNILLEGKKILLGVTGSIAAYKSANLCRLLVKAGAEVQVIFSESAKDFITPLTLSTLSKRAVLSSFTKNDDSGLWNNHVELGLWADIFLIAPSSANTLAKMANGICDNLLLATFLSARCPVVVAPAMDLDMWVHPATQQNLTLLKSRSTILIEPESGELASGLDGKGRMAEPENILSFLENYFGQLQDLTGKKVLITAGPTHEAIDPVRFIGNHSSGKMGYALAEAALKRGAEVILISGPSNLEVPTSLNFVSVTSAKEMELACDKFFSASDITIMSAAVADYTPKVVSSKKIKKSTESFAIELTKTTDILAKLGSTKSEKQILVGFALENFDEEKNAQQKLVKKNLDFIVLNSLNNKGAGFGFDTNQVKLFFANGKQISFELQSKTSIASLILDEICALLP